jgi:hypothetical protein
MKKAICVILGILLAHRLPNQNQILYTSKPKLKKSLTIRLADPYPNGWDWMLPKITYNETLTHDYHGVPNY